ncbi:hypothetical protein D3C79_1089730 [compost metagenome]
MLLGAVAVLGIGATVGVAGVLFRLVGVVFMETNLFVDQGKVHGDLSAGCGRAAGGWRGSSAGR